MKKFALLPVVTVLIAAGLLVAGEIIPPKEQPDMHTQSARALDDARIPPIDKQIPRELSTAVFGMG